MTRHFRLLVALAGTVVACDDGQSSSTGEDTTTTQPTATVEIAGVQPVILDKSQLAQLRWIEGTWRGTSANMPPFYERYTFANDSTLVMYSLRDTSGAVNDSTTYVLRDGTFSNTGDGARWIAIAIGDDSVRFAPLARASNMFTWKRTGDNSWTALLEFPASGDREASSRTYQMRRVRDAN